VIVRIVNEHEHVEDVHVHVDELAREFLFLVFVRVVLVDVNIDLHV